MLVTIIILKSCLASVSQCNAEVHTYENVRRTQENENRSLLGSVIEVKNLVGKHFNSLRRKISRRMSRRRVYSVESSEILSLNATRRSTSLNGSYKKIDDAKARPGFVSILHSTDLSQNPPNRCSFNRSISSLKSPKTQNFTQSVAKTPIKSVRFSSSIRTKYESKEKDSIVTESLEHKINPPFQPKKSLGRGVLSTEHSFQSNYLSKWENKQLKDSISLDIFTYDTPNSKNQKIIEVINPIYFEQIRISLNVPINHPLLISDFTDQDSDHIYESIDSLCFEPIKDEVTDLREINRVHRLTWPAYRINDSESGSSDYDEEKLTEFSGSCCLTPDKHIYAEIIRNNAVANTSKSKNSASTSLKKEDLRNSKKYLSDVPPKTDTTDSISLPEKMKDNSMEKSEESHYMNLPNFKKYS